MAINAMHRVVVWLMNRRFAHGNFEWAPNDFDIFLLFNSFALMTKTTNINKHYTLRWNVDAIFLQPPILLFFLSRNNNEFHSSNWMYQVCSSLFVKCLMIKCKCPNVEIRTYNRNRKRSNCDCANVCAVWIDHNHYNGMQSIQSAISLSNNNMPLLTRLTVISAQMHNRIKSVSSMRLTTRISRIWK